MMNVKDWKGIAVLIEQDDDTPEFISWELLGKSRELADKLSQQLIAIILGKNVKSIAEEAIKRGADKAIIAEHELLANYKWETYSKISYDIILKYKPSILICGATPNGRDLAGRLAVRLKTGLTADVVNLDVDNNGLLLGSVPGFGGSVLALIKCEKSRPQMATVRPGIFNAIEPNTKKKGEIINFKVKLEESDVSTKLIQKIKVDQEDISKAKKLVAAGRGIGNDISKVKELASLLEASIGVTRPLADAGIMARNHQVGSTGVTVKPKLSLVLGASGAMHFTSGIQDSDTIIAINMDNLAQIFDYADYAVVGDLNELLPELLQSLKEKIYQKVK